MFGVLSGVYENEPSHLTPPPANEILKDSFGCMDGSSCSERALINTLIEYFQSESDFILTFMISNNGIAQASVDEIAGMERNPVLEYS